MVKRKALGSGLEALLGTQTKSSSIKIDETDGTKKLLSIPLDKISRNKNQPRKNFSEDSLASLGAAIKERGQLIPIIVRKTEEGYELIAGERRWRAMQAVREDVIQAIVMEATDQESAVIAIVENVQREQLNAIEEAEALEKLRNEYQMTHDDIAKFTGKSRSHVTNIIRLNDLTEYIKSKLIEGLIEMGHARAVLSLNPKEQDLVIKRAIDKKLSVRSVESLAKKGLSGGKSPTISKGSDTLAIERELSEILGADLNISHSSKGKGRIQIKYNSVDELQGIIKKFRK